MQSGCTIVLDSLDTFDPTLEVACQALQWWSHELVQVNTYLTTNDAAGFDLHWDDHDVIVVQLGGEKGWEVRGPSRPAPMYRDHERNDTPSDEIVWSGTLCAGDVMHIPRGHWHQATRVARGDGHSLHATFGFVKRTGVDWLTWVVDQTRRHEMFRRDIDRWGTHPHVSATTHQLKDRLDTLIEELPQSRFLSAREAERPARRHVATAGILGPPERLVCVTEFPPQIDTSGDNVVVTAAGKELTFVPEAEPALRKLLSGEPASVSNLNRDTEADAEAIVGALLDEGICAELTPELTAGYTGLVPNVEDGGTVGDA